MDDGGRNMTDIWGIVVAAGQSRRMGSINKIWMPFHGRPVLQWTLARLHQAGVTQGVLVIQAADIARAEALLKENHWPGWWVTAGGSERYLSVLAGLKALGPRSPDEVILVHDAARFLVSSEVVARVVEKVREIGAAIPAMPVVDTVKTVADGRIQKTVPRNALVLAQTPQGFFYRILVESYRQWSGGVPTDDAEVVEQAGYPVFVVAGDARNQKLTVPEDIPLFERWLGAPDGGQT